MSPEELLKAMFKAGVDAALPSLCVPPHLPERPKGRTVIIGAGKASGAMAKALEDAWDGPLDGVVVTRYGYRLPTERLEVVEAAHPVPDAAGREAAQRIFKAVQGLTEDDLVLALISGGGSALLAAPADGISLEDKQAVNKALLASGATISEMNTVRKHLSAIKGGRLARAAYPAQVVALMISDVPGDDASIIASGPTVPDPSTNADAIAIVEKYGIDLPANVRQVLETIDETPKPGDKCFDRVENIMIATPQASLEAAAAVARDAGVTPVILGDSIEGESRDVALVHAGIARQCAMRGQPVEPPCVLISGGETTVTLTGNGKGGPNTEFLLSMAIALDGMPNIYALAGDTDGVDGSEDNAGALIYPDTLKRAEAAGISAKAMLANNDPYTFFKGIGDLLETGPTMTNVNDLRLVLITND
ncbi:glycerate kinase type-2 family protein [Methyloceanibacter caenitepidi]|uniref:D-glycerate 2-kinase n=1 Tax=Methyloceanibacter caenitepidi TaxID=1384459 RepID=A0A0A8K9M9_9HYPH|nr:glycerate kinase [Methyloceanibacter caenitepidi]BAQ18804.1 D-glycerate 2-kinase [Methyloceanibacter caenitepidi]